MSARRTGRFIVLLAAQGAAWLAGACATSPQAVNGLEVVISANGLSAPADFDDIKLELSQQGSGGSWNRLWDRDYVVPSAEATLPTTFTVLAGQNPDEVLITVTAFKGGGAGKPIVQRVAQVQVPTDRMALLYMVLAQSCEGQVVVTGSEGEPMSTCPTPDQSCQPDTGKCGSNIVNASTLATYVPGQSLEAGVVSGDATPPEESGASDVSMIDHTQQQADVEAGPPPDADSGGPDAPTDTGTMPPADAGPDTATADGAPEAATTPDGSAGDGSSEAGADAAPDCAPLGLSPCSGACVNKNNDILNCGVCGNVCGGPYPYCDNGSCTTAPCDGGSCSAACCGTVCCGTGELCCVVPGGAPRPPSCVSPVNGTCPVGCPLCP